MAFLDENGLAKLWSLIKAEDEKLAAADVKIATGTYVGTGKYGSKNKNSLTFDFEPKIVHIAPDGNGTNIHGGEFMIGTGSYSTTGSYTSAFGQVAAFDKNTLTLTWYHNINGGTAVGQLNVSGVTYRYVAIG